MSNVKNSITSMNYWFETVLKPVFNTTYGSPVCFFYEPNQKLAYPSVVIHQIKSGERTTAYERCNLFEFHIFTKGDADMKNWDLQDAFFETTGLTTDNVLMIKQIPLYGWTNKNSPVDIGCIRLSLNPGQGFTQLKDNDPRVRHYRIDLETYYK